MSDADVESPLSPGVQVLADANFRFASAELVTVDPGEAPRGATPIPWFGYRRRESLYYDGPPYRWRSEALFDTQVCPTSVADLFTSTPTFTPLPGRTFLKLWGVDTNLQGCYGSFPPDWTVEVHGFSVAILDLERRALPAAELAAVNGLLTFESPTEDKARVPLAACLYSPAGDADQDALVLPYQAPPVYPLAFPIVVQELQAFRVRVVFHGRDMGPVLVRVTMHCFVGVRPNE